MSIANYKLLEDASKELNRVSKLIPKEDRASFDVRFGLAALYQAIMSITAWDRSPVPPDCETGFTNSEGIFEKIERAEKNRIEMFDGEPKEQWRKDLDIERAEAARKGRIL